MLGFVRSYVDSSNMDERKKIRRVKYFIKKKTKDIILDRRVSSIVSFLLLIGLPFYMGHQSKNPVYFGMYSAKLMLVNTVYILLLISSIGLFIYHSRTHKKKHP
jgi:NADH:ubiquinone oxidoreductase subunit 5 (subunit L)/multisubunit Na+/H+ antiporter MnhA subunit